MSYRVNPFTGQFDDVGPSPYVMASAIGIDTTGTTDQAAALNAILESGQSVFIDGTVLVGSTIDVPGRVGIYGCGPKSSIIRGDSVSGPIIRLAQVDTPLTCYNSVVKSIQIQGSATEALRVDCALIVRLEDIAIGPDRYGLGNVRSSFTRGVVIKNSWGSKLSNITTNGSLITGSCFTFGNDVNACHLDNLYTSNPESSHNFVFDSVFESGNGAQHGNLCSMLTAQGGAIGVFIGASSALSINTLYVENCPRPVVIGDDLTSKIARNISGSNWDLGGGYPQHAAYSSRAALIDLRYVEGFHLTSPKLELYQAARLVPLTFSGGGGSGAIAIARVGITGAIHSVELLNKGTGYSTTPSVAVGGSGSGATVTAEISGGEVTALTLGGGGGSGYGDPGTPFAVRYMYAYRVMIDSPYCRADSPGALNAVYPWICRATGAASNAGVNVRNDLSVASGGEWQNPAELLRVSSYGHQHVVRYVDASGNYVNSVYVPPQF